MKLPLPKLSKGIQLALILTALLLLALSYWQFQGCPRLSAAGELHRMERDYQYEQTDLVALLPQRDNGYLAIGLSENRLHVTLLQKTGLWWLGKTDSHNGLISLKTGGASVVTWLPWAMPDGRDDPDYHWPVLVYAPGTQAASGSVTLTVDNDDAQQQTFLGKLSWQQDGLYLFLLDVGDHVISQHALEFELRHYLLGDPDPPRWAISLRTDLYDRSGTPLTTLHNNYPTRK